MRLPGMPGQAFNPDVRDFVRPTHFLNSIGRGNRQRSNAIKSARSGTIAKPPRPSVHRNSRLTWQFRTRALPRGDTAKVGTLGTLTPQGWKGVSLLLHHLGVLRPLLDRLDRLLGVGLRLVPLARRPDHLAVRRLDPEAVLLLAILVQLERQLVGIGLDPLDRLL